MSISVIPNKVRNVNPERYDILDTLCKVSDEADLLRKELRVIQQRLGGMMEHSDDHKRAGLIAHRLNDLFYVFAGMDT